MSTTDSTTTRTDQQVFTNVRRAARAHWSSVTPGVEVVTRTTLPGETTKVDVTVVLFFNHEGAFETATVALRTGSDEGARGVTVLDRFDRAMAWALGS